MKKSIFILAYWCFTVHTSHLFAEESDPFAFFQEEAMVMAASKHLQRLSDAPASTYVILARDIETYGYRTLAEALEQVPGMYVSNDRNYSYLWVRGFGRPGDYNGRVLVLINGHRINENIYGGAYIGNEFPIPMEAVERIEVVKGPSSSLYGDSAFFGVINVVTKSVQNAPTLHIKGYGGSDGTHKAFAAFSNKFRTHGSLYATGSHHRTFGQDLYEPYYSSTNGGLSQRADGEEDYAVYGAFHWKQWLFHANANSRLKAIPTASYGTRFNDGRSDTLDERRFYEARWDGQWLRDVEVTARAYLDWYRYKANLYSDQSGSPSVLHNLDSSVAQWWGEETRLRLTYFGERNALTMGQEYEKNLQNLQSNADEFPPTVHLETNQTPYRYACYVQQEIQLSRRVNATLGGRYDRYRTFGYTWNPRVALVVDVWSGGALKSLYGSAFRAPVPYEMFYQTPGLYKENSTLKPERIRTTELVFEQHWPSGQRLSFGGYHSRVSHLISQIKDSNDNLVHFVNKENIQSMGIEGYWQRPLIERNTHLSIGWILQETRVVGGNKLSNAPAHIGILRLEHRWAYPQTLVAVHGQVIGKRYTVQGNALPTQARCNVSVRQPWAAYNLTLLAAVYNVTNAAQTTSSAGEHNQNAISQEGRQFHVGLEWRYP